ncbi:MAG: caspase family protein [Fischerella sp.]|nr:caspase family protein [Fischerella sp.]
MANNWAIAIGINQYQFFQPLVCAQADAEALKDFLVVEAGFLQQQCLLMTDTSPPLGDRSTYPTKENILLLLEDLAAACWQPQDRLWFFFSGYGVNHNGQDYLMPQEGNPERIEETGIELRALMQSLQIAGLDALLLLDINRAFASQANALVGQEAVELAQKLQIPTIVSCQPEQFSHESSELGHGFFTAAVLEALRSGNGNTLEDLERYLSLRTPELCQHYWRPTQNPVTVIPSREQEILPSSISIEDTAKIASPVPSLEPNAHRIVTDTMKWDTGGVKEVTPWTSAATTNNLENKGVALANTSSFWKPLMLWGAGTTIVLGLFGVVYFRNQAGFKTTVEVFSTSSKSANDDAETEIIPVSPEVISRSSIANTTRNTLPPLPPSLQKNQVTSPTVLESQSIKRDQAISDLAKMSLRPNQASDLSIAIAKARNVKPGEPQYEQAQTNIQIWSKMILNLAQSRANQRKYAQAIAAAELVSPDQAIYSQAQRAIKQWRLQAKQYMANKTLLDAANALIQPRQASTYNRAIEVAKKVSPGEPGFEEAQKSIDEWSEIILKLAMRRASRGQFKAAIQTAALVPEGTSAYNKARQELQKWQSQ